MTCSRCTGQVLAEYLLVVAALVLALFLPYVDGDSVAVLLARSLLEFFRGMSFVMSIL
jgi:hypothetical protein